MLFKSEIIGMLISKIPSSCILHWPDIKRYKSLYYPPGVLIYR